MEAAKLGTEEERFLGCLVGLAVGDALGAAVEFSRPGSFTPVTDLRGGGPHRLPAGYWTDDTSMALCLAESLLEKRGFDPVDQLERYLRWRDKGHLSSTGHCFDIGNTTANALARFARTREPWCGSLSHEHSGNGSLMRLAPVPMYFSHDPRMAIELSGDSSRTTHGSRAAVDACRYFGGLIVGALRGVPKTELLSPRYSPFGPDFWSDKPLHGEIDEVAAGSFKRLRPPQIQGSGYVVRCLEAALWAFHGTSNFRDGCLAAVNLGDDADTTGAVFGQLAGAYYGLGQIPQEWRTTLHNREILLFFSRRIFRHASTSRSCGETAAAAPG